MGRLQRDVTMHKERGQVFLKNKSPRVKRVKVGAQSTPFLYLMQKPLTSEVKDGMTGEGSETSPGLS